MEIRYYTTASGNSPVRKFVEGLSRNLQEDFLLALDRLRQGEALGMPLKQAAVQYRAWLTRAALQRAAQCLSDVLFY